MAHPHSKLPACANCNYQFPAEGPDDFCPRCGQQNHEINASFGHVLEELLEGIFHFDSKVFRTAKLLLFKPGELTRQFIAGKRVSYVPPIRLYIFISFLFFFLVALDAGNTSKKKEIEAELSESTEAERSAARQTAAEGQRTLDSLQRTGTLPRGLGLKIDTTRTAKDGQSATVTLFGKTVTRAELQRLPSDPTNPQLDSIIRSKGEKTGFIPRLALKRAIRWRDASREEVTQKLVRGLTVLAFLLLPLAALLLKGAYLRQHKPYVNHLVFTIHLQCFLFLLFSAILLLERVPYVDVVAEWLPFVVPVYFVLALRNFYQQSWGRTIAKTLLLGFTYTLVLSFSMVLVAVIGLTLF